MTFRVPEKFRVTFGKLGSSAAFGNNGAFHLELKHGQKAFAIVSDQMGWEHVSVSRKDRCLNWEEMCQVKDMFWSQDACVMQFHPAASEYVDNHPFCLHLWRPINVDFPIPDSLMVGVKGFSREQILAVQPQE